MVTEAAMTAFSVLIRRRFDLEEFGIGT
jgi:hypothetical protein